MKIDAAAQFLKVANVGCTKCLNASYLKKFERKTLLLQVYGWHCSR
jgi:hypothetical protein